MGTGKVGHRRQSRGPMRRWPRIDLAAAAAAVGAVLALGAVFYARLASTSTCSTSTDYPNKGLIWFTLKSKIFHIILCLGLVSFRKNFRFRYCSTFVFI